jgi:hypothetical protein
LCPCNYEARTELLIPGVLLVCAELGGDNEDDNEDRKFQDDDDGSTRTNGGITCMTTGRTVLHYPCPVSPRMRFLCLISFSPSRSRHKSGGAFFRSHVLKLIKFVCLMLMLLIFDSRIYRLPSDGHLDTRTVPLAILVGMYTDGIRVAVYRQSPYTVRPWPYNGRCAALVNAWQTRAMETRVGFLPSCASISYT